MTRLHNIKVTNSQKRRMQVFWYAQISIHPGNLMTQLANSKNKKQNQQIDYEG